MKIIYRMLLISLFFLSCKMTSNTDIIPKKKTNILECTKWKTSGASEGDSILDFHTSNSVTEYIFLDGKETAGRKGTYKVKNRIVVEIKWSKLISDTVSGTINDKTMELTEGNGLKKIKYYKIAEY